jgi:hypothetical protein
MVHTGSAQRHIPEDGILHSHRHENLKSYTIFFSINHMDLYIEPQNEHRATTVRKPNITNKHILN